MAWLVAGLIVGLAAVVTALRDRRRHPGARLHNRDPQGHLDLLADQARTRLHDGLSCFAAVAAAGCLHEAVVVGQRLPRELPQFHWVNTVLGNLKTALAGTHHAFDFAKYAASYLVGFAYRFNRASTCAP